MDSSSLVVMKNKQAVTSSLQVAETFGKDHNHIIRDIEKLLEGLSKNGHTQHMFVKGTYVNEQNSQQYSMYYMNRDGFTLLAMGFTGYRALQFKLKYIEAFNVMEQTIKELPMKKLDPVTQAEIEITKAKTHQANALYRIAMKTDSQTAQQSILARAAEAITGEMTIPIMKSQEYSAKTVGEKLGISANMVGRIANRISLKAEQPGQNQFGRWSNSKSQYSDKEVPQWLYTEAGVKEIKRNM